MVKNSKSSTAAAATTKNAPKTASAGKGKPVGAVLNAIKILRYLSNQTTSISVTQIARELEINASTCFNILRTMAHEDFVTFDSERKLYGIGLGVTDLAKGATILGRDINDLRSLIERVAREHDVTVTLWRRIAEDRIMLILAAFANANTRIHMSVGERLPLLIGSAGRVMAAFSDMPPSELRKQFKQIRWDQPMTFEEFMAEVSETRSRGWSIDKGNYLTGIASVAVPVFNSEGQFAMACTATMFVNQFDETRAGRLGADLSALSQWSKPFGLDQDH